MFAITSHIPRKSHQHLAFTSGRMSYDLCEELIVEIFTRLPIKSLLRFRSVSKSLCACIGSPRFIRLHTQRSTNKVMVIHQVYLPYSKTMYTLHSGGQMSCDPCIGVTAVDYPFKNFIIVGSCNGILCLYEYANGIYLWNPAIRRKVTRPSWSDPEGLWAPLGFGFDSNIDDYKILVSARCNTEKGGVIERTFVYTMKTDDWREVAFPATPYAYSRPYQCLFNGVLHWPVNRYDPGDDCHYFILTFDLNSEVFSKIELPEPSWETNQVTVINGSLAVISSSKEYGETWIWVKKNATSWSVAFKLNTREFEGAQRVFQLTPNEDLLFNPSNNGIIVYNPETSARSRFVGLSGSSRDLLVTPCIESLGLLDIMEETSCDHQEKK